MIPASARNSTSSLEGAIVHLVVIVELLRALARLTRHVTDSGHGTIMATLQEGGGGLKSLRLGVHLPLQLQVLHAVAQQPAGAAEAAQAAADGAADHPADSRREHVADAADQTAQHAAKPATAGGRRLRGLQNLVNAIAG